MTSNTTSRTYLHTTDVTDGSIPDPRRRDTAVRQRAGIAWITGGVLWATAGLLYAESGWQFRASSAVWLAADVLLAAGVVGLLLLRPHGPSRTARAALIVALVARGLFAIAEVSALVTGTENELLLPIAALLTAVSSIAYAALAQLAGRRVRVASLVMGLYFFVAMMPFLAITGEPNPLAIAGWGIPAALVGIAVLRSAGSRPVITPGAAVVRP